MPDAAAWALCFARHARPRSFPSAPPVCRRCGSPRLRAALCAACRRTPSALDGILSSAVFAPPLRTVIHHFKYRNARALAAPLAARLITAWLQAGLSADLIVPVPLHASRASERGYNQSALLAQRLGSAVGVAVAERPVGTRAGYPPADASESPGTQPERERRLRLPEEPVGDKRSSWWTTSAPPAPPWKPARRPCAQQARRTCKA